MNFSLGLRAKKPHEPAFLFEFFRFLTNTFFFSFQVGVVGYIQTAHLQLR